MKAGKVLSTVCLIAHLISQSCKPKSNVNPTAYGQSKTANLLFAKSLADRYKNRPAGSEIISLSVHPGVINTNLSKNLGSSVVKFIFNTFIVDKSIPQGAATTVWASLCPELAEKNVAGSYCSDCSIAVPTTDQAQDVDGRNQVALWSLTEELIAAVTTTSTPK